MDVETRTHARVLALAADKLRHALLLDEDLQDQVSVIALRLDGLAELLLDEA